ncbi:hypothetical protein [Pseudidiomarina sp.]|uniref:hypothetical protein n=1 Tax=Pseudidiomarina sp. TaxID=2081707 RepID=UPI003A975255
MEEIEVYRVLMDERWELEDLYDFPYTYSQIHSFIYCFDFNLDENKEKRIDSSLINYPWQGGYSYTNIYRVLQGLIPKEDTPKIAEIKYASPGWIDLFMNPDVALQVAKSVGILVGAGVAAVEGYKRIDKARLEMARNRKKQQMEFAEFSANEVKYLNQMSEELAKSLGFESLQKLNARTKNPEVTLKLLLAHHRRMNKLTEYIALGKASLPEKIEKKLTNKFSRR